MTNSHEQAELIPAEAGIAAVKAYVAMRNAGHHATPQEYALAMLEAAGPFIAAEAFHRGYVSAIEATTK